MVSGFSGAISFLVAQHGHGVYDGSESNTRKHIENTTFFTAWTHGFLNKIKEKLP